MGDSEPSAGDVDTVNDIVAAIRGMCQADIDRVDLTATDREPSDT
jgi:hypothetical protein